MSYSTLARPTARRGGRYKEMEVLSATPGELVVIVYDHLLTSLLRARQAIVAGDVEARLSEMGRARDAVAELLGTLDRARGGAVAEQLAGLYAFFLRELSSMGAAPTLPRVDRLVAMVRELREAFVAIEPKAAR